MTTPTPTPSSHIARLAPPRPDYLVIDGTLAGDGARFAWLMERRGHFVNVLDTLPPVPKDKGRLDPGEAHAYLPIHRLELGQIRNPSADQPGQPAFIDNVNPTDDRQRGVVVVCPAGLNGFGKDSFWRRYREGDDDDGRVAKADWDGRLTYGRHTAFERSVRAIEDLILCPGIEHERLADGSYGRGRLLTDLREAGDGLVRTADLVFVSSHGYLGGFLETDRIQGWSEAEPAFVPGKDKGAARGTTTLASMFLLGKVAKEGRRFTGPRWLVFAACSVVNEATWAYWVGLFERSDPWVRGILAYEEVAPDAGIANQITDTFFKRLDAGDTLLDAWRTANGAHKTEGKPTRWAAIVHEQALTDTLANWSSQGELDPKVVTTATAGRYRGYHSPAPAVPGGPPPDTTIATDGRPVRDVQPAFRLKVEHLVDGADLPAHRRGWKEVLPENLNSSVASMHTGRSVRLTVEPSAAAGGALITSARVEMVHIRGSRPRVPWSSVWQADPARPWVDARAATTTLDDGKAVLTITSRPDVANPSLVVSLERKPALGHPDVEEGHSYFWFRVQLVLDDGTSPSYDFTMQGLLY